jgi:hypothetical protein
MLICGSLSNKKEMNKSNSNSKSDTIDYYAMVAGIRPGRSPSIFHKEYQYYWTDFPVPPVYTIFNTTFHKITPLPHCVDCTRFGQIHFWVRTGTPYCPTLVVISFTPPFVVKKVRYYFYNGLEISLTNGSFRRVTAPDKELFNYCLSGFFTNYLAAKYDFSSMISDKVHRV